MSDTQNNNPTTETKKKSKLPLLIGLVVVLLLGGGGGFYLWTRMASAADEKTAEKDAKGKKSKTKAEDHAKTDEHAEEPKADEHGETKGLSLPDDEDVTSVVELQPFIVNLADIEQARYLRMTVSVGIGGESHGEEKPNPLFLTRVKNAMLSVLTTKSSTDVLTVEGKQKLRGELLKAAQAVSHEPEIHAIYITDFIVQL